MCAPCIMHRCLNLNNRWSPPPRPGPSHSPLRLFTRSTPSAWSFPFPTPGLYPVEPLQWEMRFSLSRFRIFSLLFPQASFILPASLSFSPLQFHLLFARAFHPFIKLSLSLYMSHPLSIRVPPFDLATARPESGEVTIPFFFFWPSDPGRA